MGRAVVGQRGGESLPNGYRISVRADEKVTGTEDGDGCTL